MVSTGIQKLVSTYDLPDSVGGVYSEVVKTQSAKICLNLNFRVGVLWSSENSKCQDLPKFKLGGGAGGYSGVVKTLSAKICLNLNFRGEGYPGVVKTQSAKICLNLNFQGGGYSEVVKTQSAKICLNLIFLGGGVVWSSQNSWCQDLPKFQFFLGGGSLI